jgi:hypothetical protein
VRSIAFLFAVAAACVAMGGSALAACGQGDPTGYFRGTAQSKEAGPLKVAINLRCDAAAYAGELETPLGTFHILDGSFANGEIRLTFGKGPTADVGTILLVLRGTVGSGTFALGADSGTVTVERAGDARPLVSAVPTLNLTAEQWRADVAFLADALTTRHVDPFALTSHTAFDREVDVVASRAGTVDGDAMYVQLDHLANLIGDGHTYVEFPPDSSRFPLLFRRFGDAYRVVAVTAGGESLLGTRVLAIDGVPIGRAHDALLAITPIGETTELRDTRATSFLSLGIALHGAGIIADRSRATFEVRDDAGRTSATIVHAMTPAQADAARYIWVWKSTALYHQQPEKSFWYTYLPEARTVYCRFDAYDDLEKNAAGLFELVRTKHPEKLAIDLRLNGGGDFNAGLRFLIDPIAKMPQIDRKGHLFVLVGPSTFSAAMSNAAQFRTRTHALLVGQTIGERPNSSQEPNEVRLPNSHLALRYSTKRYAFAPNGPNAIVPDIEAAPTWEQYRAGEDPALTAVLRYPTSQGKGR